MKLFLSFILFASFSIAQHTHSLHHSLQEYIRNYTKIKELPGVVAGVALGDSLFFATGSGYSSLELQVPADTNSVFRIASISKFITGIAVMILVEQGKLSLEKPIKTWLPDIPADKANITIPQLLSHTSGLRAYRDGEFHSVKKFNSTTEVYNFLKNDALEAKPGEKYIYSTLAYTFVSKIIENVTGKSFGDFLQEAIFTKAGMHSTRLDVQEHIVKGRAYGYYKNAQREFINAPLADLSIKYPGGGVLSTLPDLLRLGKALAARVLLTDSSLTRMMQPTRLNNGEIKSYGLGVDVKTDAKGREFIGHFGGGTGFVSNIIIYPKEHYVAAHLINCVDRNNTNPADELLGIALNERHTNISIPAGDVFLASLKKNPHISTDSLYSVLEESTQYDMSEQQIIWSAVDYAKYGTALSATNFLKTAIQHYPKSAVLYLALAETYEADGNTGLARRNYLKVLEFDPNNQKAKQKTQ